jgi:probable F420-dependent oxidoreductase
MPAPVWRLRRPVGCARRAGGRHDERVRFSYAESMIDPTFYAPLAQAVEEAGYDSFVVPDSIFYPETSDSTYPYNPDGTREFLEDKPFLEPFTLIPALGAVTRQLRFTTFVVKLPIRHPVFVAKQAGSVAVLTGDRLALGVGTSPWPEDYLACGVPWERRGKRMDEAIDVIRGLTGGGFVEYHGEIFDIPSLKMSPVPSRPIPILIGGHADAALRRAARVGDGWMHGGGDPADLPRLLERVRVLRQEYGRDHLPFEVHAISLDAYTLDGVRRLADEGVTDVIVGFRWPYAVGPDTEPLQVKLDNLRRYADDVIAKA